MTEPEEIFETDSKLYEHFLPILAEDRKIYTRLAEQLDCSVMEVQLHFMEFTLRRMMEYWEGPKIKYQEPSQ